LRLLLINAKLLCYDLHCTCFAVPLTAHCISVSYGSTEKSLIMHGGPEKPDCF